MPYKDKEKKKEYMKNQIPNSKNKFAPRWVFSILRVFLALGLVLMGSTMVIMIFFFLDDLIGLLLFEVYMLLITYLNFYIPYLAISYYLEKH